ncbi:hypothetical protein [Sphingobacterium bambusae]|uniref:Uncharacterized protein n=1 Tax=Sphingobacterium bambusae TaxID=662858 RepID=A0ABW6BMS6_9SPHI|nr:hypothetical protein [Sphingobacterium bambusae]WPL47890.1 hypothetical protein SCB77_18230 [Sphingobacterium bambusae]
MKLKPKDVNDVTVYDNINLHTSDGIIDFKNFWDSEFRYGQQMFFFFHRLEDLTEDKELDEIEKELLQIFNEENLYIIIYIDEVRFIYLFNYNFQLGGPDLIVKFWKYYYSMCIIVPTEKVSFESVCGYFDTHRDNDVYLRNFKAKGYAQRIYIKGLGGDCLIKN